MTKTREIYILILLFLLNCVEVTWSQDSVYLFSYRGDVNTPVCNAPVDAVFIQSDYGGIRTIDPAYSITYSSMLNGFELRQQGSVRISIIQTSSVYPTQQELGYDLELSGTDNVFARTILNNERATPLPELLQQIGSDIQPDVGPSLKLVFLFADVVSELDQDGTLIEAQSLRDFGYDLAGVTSSSDGAVQTFLEDFTGDPGHVFVFDSAISMANSFTDILRTMCSTQQQTLAPAPVAAQATTPTDAPITAAQTAAPTAAPTEAPTTPTTASSLATTPTAASTLAPQPATSVLAEIIPVTTRQVQVANPPVVVTTFPPRNTQSVISRDISVNPRFGPESGGTLVTLIGQQLRDGFRSIKIDSLDCQVISKAGNVITCKTSSNAGTPVGSDVLLKIVLVSNFGSSIEIPNAFTYKTNPILEDVYPVNTIVSGGILITFTGRNLDSAAKADILVNVKRNSITTETFRERCLSGTWSQIICPSPKLNIRGVTQRNIQKRSLNSRERRQLNSGLLNGNDVDFSVGIELDGMTSYTDYRTINVYIDPVIFPFEKSPYVYTSPENIEIKGERLTFALGKNDYIVSIGDEICDISDLLENRIICQPTRKPSSKSRDPLDGAFKVHVTVGTGNLRYLVGGLTYQNNMWKYLWPLVAAVICIAGIILSCVVICVLKCTRTM